MKSYHYTPLLAAIDDDQQHHAAALRSVKASGPRLLSPFVLAELDYLLATRVGQAAELALLREDERHFRAVRGLGGRPFQLFPGDAP